jgi:hypothetical protein
MPELPLTNRRPPLTDDAWVLKTDAIRKGRRIGRWIAAGEGRHNPDGSTDVYLHSLPIGGFDGHVQLTPKGRRPVDIMSEPQRPSAAGGDDDEEEFDDEGRMR